MTETSLTQASRQELEKARTKGQVIGWLQGGGAVLAVGLALKMVGFVPMLAIGAVVVYIAYRLLRGKSSR